MDFRFVRHQTNQLMEKLAEGTIMVDIDEQDQPNPASFLTSNYYRYFNYKYLWSKLSMISSQINLPSEYLWYLKPITHIIGNYLFICTQEPSRELEE